MKHPVPSLKLNELANTQFFLQAEDAATERQMSQVDKSKIKAELLLELKSFFTAMIESKFKDLELRLFSDVHNKKSERPSTCHGLHDSVTTEFCLAQNPENVDSVLAPSKIQSERVPNLSVTHRVLKMQET